MSELLDWPVLVQMRQACVPKLTQRAMGVRLGISSMYMSDLENGKRGLSPERHAQYQHELELFIAEHKPLEAAPAPSVEVVMPAEAPPAVESLPIEAEPPAVLEETDEVSGAVLKTKLSAAELPHATVDAPPPAGDPPAAQ
jgi:transcriptional regulator with XRE-family HTH domain